MRVPDFALPVQGGTPTRLYARIGGMPSVLILSRDAHGDIVRQFAERLQKQVTSPLALCCVVETENTDGMSLPGVDPVFADGEGRVSTACGADTAEGPVAYLLDPNLRLLLALDPDDADAAARIISVTLRTEVAAAAPRQIETQAPVLLIDRVITADLCSSLMDRWESEGSEETGVELTHAGQRRDVIRHDTKRRRDHVIVEEKLMGQLASTIGRRVMPEVHKSFAFRASRFEGFKIARYDAKEGGFFHAHRDNLSPATLHRRFALTVNLNDDYEGGRLRFPEYGQDLYSPRAGAAIVFSCSHLHEVTPVTAGSRFALLSFLFDEAASSRSANKK